MRRYHTTANGDVPFTDEEEAHRDLEIAAAVAASIAAHNESIIPKSVTRRQAKQALLLAGLLSHVQPALDAIPDATQRGLAQIEWDESLEFERARPLLINLATALGLSSAQLDALFVQAATL
jgi:hypothetical protein